MKSENTKIPVKGGWIVRSTVSGQVVAAETPKGVSRASEISRAAVSEASTKRGAALKRLADR